MRRHPLLLALFALILGLVLGGAVPATATPTDACEKSYAAPMDSTVKLKAYTDCREDRQDAALARIEKQLGSTPTPSPTPSSTPSPTVKPTPTPTVSPSPTPTRPTTSPSTTAGWSADLAGVPAGSMGCNANGTTPTVVALKKQWDYWDNCGGTVVSPASAGIPPAPGSTSNVVKWQKAAGSDQVYQKLNRTFTKDNWPAGGTGKTGSPADVSGIYAANLYIPSSDFVLNPGHGWVQLLQFKENYTDASGTWHQDPLWTFGANNFSGTIKGALYPHTSPTVELSAYMDRWVRWEFRLYQGSKDTTGHGGRIELWADGKLIDTGYESQLHVGSAALSPLSRTQSWVWIAGPYTSNQTTNGAPDYMGTHATTYVGPSSVTPLGG